MAGPRGQSTGYRRIHFRTSSRATSHTKYGFPSRYRRHSRLGSWTKRHSHSRPAFWLGVGVHALLERLLLWQNGHREEKPARSLPSMVPALMSLLLLGLPLHLVWRDFPVLDRSQNDSSYLYANYLWRRLEKDARLLADFWAWAPLAYYQTIGGWRPDVWTYGALSSPDIKWEEFVPSLKSESDVIYVAAGGAYSPWLVD